MEKNFLLGVGVANTTEEEVLKYITKSLEKGDKNYYIATPNPEILVYANRHPKFKSILNNARLACPDGIGVIWAGKVLGKNFKERVTGVDLVKKLCERVNEKPITVGFLGGGPKIAEQTSLCLLKEFPKLNIVFAAPEWPEGEHEINKRFKIQDSRIKNGEKIINHESLIMNHSQIDILFVAYGFPKQEEWMAKNLNKVTIRVMIGVGGAFDYISGNVPYAPVFVRNLGFEWLFRLIVEPWRAKRQLALLEFIWLVFKEKLRYAIAFSLHII